MSTGFLTALTIPLGDPRKTETIARKITEERNGLFLTERHQSTAPGRKAHNKVIHNVIKIIRKCSASMLDIVAF